MTDPSLWDATEMAVDDRLLEAGWTQADVALYRRWWATGAGYDTVWAVETIDGIEQFRLAGGF